MVRRAGGLVDRDAGAGLCLVRGRARLARVRAAGAALPGDAGTGGSIRIPTQTPSVQPAVVQSAWLMSPKPPQKHRTGSSGAALQATMSVFGQHPVTCWLRLQMLVESGVHSSRVTCRNAPEVELMNASAEETMICASVSVSLASARNPDAGGVARTWKAGCTTLERPVPLMLASSCG